MKRIDLARARRMKPAEWKQKAPFELTTFGKPIAVVIDYDRFVKLFSDGTVGVCGSFISALVAEPFKTRRELERERRLRRLGANGKNDGRSEKISAGRLPTDPDE